MTETRLSLVTPINNRLGDFVVDFLISARTTGGHEGPLVLIDYGIKKKVRQVADKANVTYATPRDTISNHVSIDRWSQYANVLDEVVDTEYAALFDADIWFQRPIEDVIEHIPENGILFGPGGKRREPFWGPEHLKKEFRRRANFIAQNYNGVLNCGFMAGKTDILKERMLEYRQYITEINFDKQKKAWDQSVWQYLFDPDRDSMKGTTFNTIPRTEDFPVLDRNGDIAYVIHLAGRTRRRQHHHFKNAHQDKYEEFMNGL